MSVPGSARVSRAVFGVSPNTVRQKGLGETPKPARGTRALPGTTRRVTSVNNPTPAELDLAANGEWMGAALNLQADSFVLGMRPWDGSLARIAATSGGSTLEINANMIYLNPAECVYVPANGNFVATGATFRVSANDPTMTATLLSNARNNDGVGYPVITSMDHASGTQAGVVKVGPGLTIDAGGTLSATGGAGDSSPNKPVKDFMLMIPSGTYALGAEPCVLIAGPTPDYYTDVYVTFDLGALLIGGALEVPQGEMRTYDIFISSATGPDGGSRSWNFIIPQIQGSNTYQDLVIQRWDAEDASWCIRLYVGQNTAGVNYAGMMISDENSSWAPL